MGQQIKEKTTKIEWIWKSIICACIVSICMLFILSIALWKMQLKEDVIKWGIRAVYLLATFIGGFFAGKLRNKKKYLCGLMIGIVYYTIIVLISLLLNHTFVNSSTDILPTLLLCVLGGMLGGMLA